MASKRKQDLLQQFNELRQGLNDVPALLQPTPMAQLEDLNLECYEISPIEPLHDTKGHITNITDEAMAIANEETREKLANIKTTVLSKDTSDYRKAVILMYIALDKIDTESPLTDLFRTAVEINEILYASSDKRSKVQILRLHNVTFVHNMLCRELFGSPVHVTRAKMFGRYFHAIVYHAPLLYRLISTSSLYTETQERMFNQLKSITHSTSNHNPTQIITNILVRIQEEEKSHHNSSQMCSDSEENEVSKLQKCLKSKTKLILSSLLNGNRSIDPIIRLTLRDFLAEGSNSWWKNTSKGVELFDATGSPEAIACTHHFRSSNSRTIDLFLMENWERCVEQNISLPCRDIRVFKWKTPMKQFF